MNLYLDTSALIKRYIREQGTDAVNLWIAEAEITATSIITLAEANAALARAARMKNISHQTGEEASRLLREQWPRTIKTPITEKTVARAAELAWTLGLRGYDAVHLASAELWQTALEMPVSLITYDNQLAVGAGQLGMDVLPANE